MLIRHLPVVGCRNAPAPLHSLIAFRLAASLTPNPRLTLHSDFYASKEGQHSGLQSRRADTQTTFLPPFIGFHTIHKITRAQYLQKGVGIENHQHS